MDREEASYDGRPVHSVKLVILEVNNEDYEQPFVCQASNAFGQVTSYIILKRRGKKCFLFLRPVFFLTSPEEVLISGAYI